MRLMKSKLTDRVRWFKVVSVGRNGFVWKRASELPEIAVKMFDLAAEDKRVRWRDQGADQKWRMLRQKALC